jgi:hypothetical protein
LPIFFDRALRTGLESADVHSNVTGPNVTRRTQAGLQAGRLYDDDAH